VEALARKATRAAPTQGDDVMHVRWFGKPWPSDDRRAPICEDDEYQVHAPVGYQCGRCDELFEAEDQGIVMAYAGAPLAGNTFTLETEDGEAVVIAEHLHCFLYSTLGFNPRLESMS
jgi:hypothetical protein